MLRTLKAILDTPTRLTLRAGASRGPAFAGDIGAVTRRTYAVMGDTVNLAARLTGRAEPGRILASADVLEHSRTRFETSHEPFLVKGKDRPVVAYTRRCADGRPRAGARAAAARRPRRGARGAARRRSTRRACGSSSSSSSSASRGSASRASSPSCGRSRSASSSSRRAARRTRARTRSSPSARCCGRSRGSRPSRRAEAAGAQLAPFIQTVMPDLAPWLPLLAVPFGAEVPSTPGDRRDRRRLPPRQAARGRLAVHDQGAADADADRRRGRPLDRRRLGLPAAPPRRRARSRGRGSCA